MGRDLQKRKRRSSRPVIRQSNTYKKLRNPLGNTTIAKNWNKDETMTQNYRRLGLMARLKAPTGGTEKFPSSNPNLTKPQPRPFQIPTSEASVVSEAVVERDSAGKITSIKSIGGKKRSIHNPLNDPLNDLETDSESDQPAPPHHGEEWSGFDDDKEGVNQTTDVVRQLEAEAAQVQPSRPRTQSAREQDWIGVLVGKHGDDVAAMARDKALNRMQQTEGDIARRVRKWRASHPRNV